MADYRDKTPKIAWGSGFANTLVFGLPLDAPKSYSKSKQDSKWINWASGVEEAYIIGGIKEKYLEAMVRWIQPNDTTAGPTFPWTSTGWDGATGWGAAIEWFRDKNQMHFFPDESDPFYITCYLAEPMEDPPELEEGGRGRSLPITLRTVTGSFVGY